MRIYEIYFIWTTLIDPHLRLIGTPLVSTRLIALTDKFNPTGKENRKSVSIPAYYTGLDNEVNISRQCKYHYL